MNKLPVLAINIDGCVRDFLSRFDKQYRKVYIYNPALVDTDDTGLSIKELTEEQLTERDGTVKDKERELIHLPVTTYDLLNHYKFEEKTIEMTLESKDETLRGNQDAYVLTPQKHMEDFIEKYPFQIYGDAEEIQGATEAVNKIQRIGLDSNMFETVLVSTLKSRAIPATYFFLSKFNCRVRRIMFLDKEEDKWAIDNVAAVVDVNPLVISEKPKGKICVKVETTYNQWDQADFNIKHVKELCSTSLLERIFNNENK